MKKLIHSAILLFGLLCMLTSSFGQDAMIEWTFNTSGKVYSSPCIVGNTLFIGSLDSCLYAIDRHSGSEIWRYKTGNQIFSSPSVFDTLVCIESGNELYVLSTSGNLVSKFSFDDKSYSNQNDNWDYFHSSPTIHDGVAYLGLENGVVKGVDLQSGSEVFSCQAGDHSIETSPLIYSGKIFFGDWDGVFYAYNLTTKDLSWSYDTKDDHTYGWDNAIQTDPVIYNGEVMFTGRSCNFYSLDPSNGFVNWMHHSPSSEWLFAISLDDSVAYLGSSNQRLVQAFNANNGEVIWQSKLDWRIFGKPLVLDDYIIVGTGWETTDSFGSVYALDKHTGEVINRFATYGQVHSSITEKDGILYFGCADNRIYAIGLDSLINFKRPSTGLSCDDIVDLGVINASVDFDTTLYVKNSGEGEDSVTISINGSRIEVTPVFATIASGDSVAVDININASDFEEGLYSRHISCISHMSILPESTKKNLRFEIEGSSSVVLLDDKPMQTRLVQNYPNPFYEQTHIKFYLSKSSEVNLSVYNLSGKLVTTLFSGYLDSGEHNYHLRDENFEEQFYIVHLKTENAIYTRSMLRVD